MKTDRTVLQFIVVAILPLFASLLPATTRAGDFSGTVEAGFDSFTEQYTIVEEDTLDQLNEFKTRIGLRYLMGTLFDSHFMVEARGMIGGQSVENSGRVGFQSRGANNRFFAEGLVTHRDYRAGTTYSFPNDFMRYNARAYYQRRITPAISLRLSDRFEVVDFDQRTEFDYDYAMNRVVLSAELENAIASGYQAAVGYTRKEIPDSTEIEYHAATAAFEYRRATGLQRQIFVSTSGERRVYDDGATRSSHWSALVLANIHPITFGSFGVGLDLAGEAYDYDQNTSAYFDYVETRWFLFASYFRGFSTTVRLGSTGGFLLSEYSEQDEYYEAGMRLALDHFSGERLWLSAAYEVGYRDYLYQAPSEFEQIFSDFTYHSVSLLTTLRVLSQMSFNVLASYEPEDHAVRSDDSTSALFSASLAYEF